MHQRSIGFVIALSVTLGLTGCDLIERARGSDCPEADSSAQKVRVGPGDAIGDGAIVAIAPPKISTASPVPVQPPAGAPGTFADLAFRCDPGVVFVRTLTSERRGYRRVLGEASGSGFIFDSGGKILTNYHVVSGARAVQVELRDGRALMGNIVGADPLTDLAILSVDAQDLPALPLGDSDAVRVGDWVLAIGNPLGLAHTVSAGIISAKERTGRDVELGNPEAYYSFLQTDASINPGNSGGPLIDLLGQVVGINTAINQGANSIGFAIPVNMIKRLLPRLLKDGKINRAAIGVSVSDVDSDAIQLLKLTSRNGALIQDVSPGGPADRAGARPGDVIVEFDAQPIKTPDDLRWNASLSTIGKEVSMVVIRNAQRETLRLRPAELRTH